MFALLPANFGTQAPIPLLDLLLSRPRWGAWSEFHIEVAVMAESEISLLSIPRGRSMSVKRKERKLIYKHKPDVAKKQQKRFPYQHDNNIRKIESCKRHCVEVLGKPAVNGGKTNRHVRNIISI